MINDTKPTVRNVPLRLFGTASDSIVDGPGLRFVIFVQGCPHACPGCHNPQSHDPNGGTLSSTTELWEKIAARPEIAGVTFSGGEPFTHAEALAEIGKAVRAMGKTVMTYSGYTYERLLDMARTDPHIRALLSCTNYLVDGPFVLAQRDITLKYRGSKNQRVLDITCYPNSEAVNIADFA
jgi:anaerobic ribonucleoside-triphosphate reductase activating protein